MPTFDYCTVLHDRGMPMVLEPRCGCGKGLSAPQKDVSKTPSHMIHCPDCGEPPNWRFLKDNDPEGHHNGFFKLTWSDAKVATVWPPDDSGAQPLGIIVTADGGHLVWCVRWVDERVEHFGSAKDAYLWLIGQKEAACE